MIPQTLLIKLKEQIRKVQIIHEKDLRDGWGIVELPNCLTEKLPEAGKELNVR